MEAAPYHNSLATPLVNRKTEQNTVLAPCRIIPVVVVVYRVLMVCYVDFCYTHGEKQIRDQLCRYPTQYYYKPIYSIYFTQFYLRLCLMFPLLMGGISVIYHHNLR